MRFWTTITMAMVFTVSWSSITSAAQSPDTVDAHVATAREAAGQEHVALFDTVCKPATTARPPGETPNRSNWYREPVKVFTIFTLSDRRSTRLGQ
jgi:hypothetical protein